MVIVQNPATARFGGMPGSLPPSAVDVVAELESIGPLLGDLVTGAYMPTEARDERVLRLFLDQLRQRTGIDFSAYKRPTILRRLQRRMAAVGIADLRAYVRYTEAHPEERQRLVANFLIKVTTFMRDPDLFEHLRAQVLPRLVDEARERGNELRIWSAGCATGEEAYSLAMLVADVLGDEMAAFRVRIFATDLDEGAVQAARRGVYRPAATVNLPRHMVERYLERVDDHFEVTKPIRAMLVFGQHDLAQRAPFPRIDLAMCRNVLIYFTPDLQRRALQLFAFALREGGWLVLGKSEATTALGDVFVVEDPRLKVYRRQGGSSQAATGRILEGLPRLPPRPASAGQGAPAEPGDDPSPERPPRVDPSDRLFYGLPVGVVLVDRRYDVLHINPAARRLLGIPRPAVGEDIVHLSRHLPQRELAAAIDAALRGETTSLDDVEVEDALSGVPRTLRVTCAPHPADAPDKRIEAAQVVVVDRTDDVRRRRDGADERERVLAENERLRARVHQLEQVSHELSSANEELIATNAELTRARDAFVIGNEEAQAALEEVETLNEEQQATNEELETLNEELQATIEELNTTNEDLAARDAESRRMAATLTDERARLAAVLAGMSDAVAVVDREGTLVRTNAAYDRLATTLSAEAARAEDGRLLGPDEMPGRRAARGEAFSMQFTLTAAEGGRRWFEANGQPLASSDPEVGVVVIRDITERSLRRLQEEFVALVTHELRTPLAVVQAHLQLLVRTLPASDDRLAPRQLAGIAAEHARRLTALVQDLQDVARLQSGQFRVVPEPVDLRPVVGTAVDAARAVAPERAIEFDANAEPVVASADPGRIQQVVLNLLTNALQHAPDSPRVDVRLRRAEDSAEVQVQDRGPGIAPEHLPHLFERFYRAEASEVGGLGLGLWITRAIVTAHGGTIEVSSTQGRGTTVTVRLPLVAHPAEGSS
jgi:two-component system CheB/CheR fusion protein